MAGRGLARVRTLVELRRPLPVDPAHREHIRAVPTRPFDPTTDLQGLLEVNNAAFSWHPDQGGWDRARLRQALEAPWVSLEGILVHEAERDGHGDGPRIDGFCWTRLHTHDEPGADGDGDPPGEIFVIGTHPGTHGTGLGSALVVAGLDHLHRVGARVVNLFTEADNHAALAMYQRMGFGIHERRGGYMRIDPSGTEPEDADP